MSCVSLLRAGALLALLACSPGESGPIGMPAPEIEGADLDGVAFRLSDYQGKVVLLEFWGSWWEPCREMFPHTRDIAERYADAPFVVIGVNSDTQLDRLQLVMGKQGIEWRSFWDGPKGAKGPISRAWGVEQWPTVCLIDAQGVLRYRTATMDVLAIDTQIQKLLAETDKRVGVAR